MKYRDIYRLHHGDIPVDEDGRTYDIHHINGNRQNNNIFNLVALTIVDHYEVHKIQGDWRACTRIALKMKKSPQEISELVSKQQRARVRDGTHHFIGGGLQRATTKKLIDEGKHHFQNSEVQSKINLKRYKNGTGNFGSELSKKTQKKLIETGTHNFIVNNPVYKQLAEGRHPFLGRKQEKKTCSVCDMTMTLSNYVRWGHGDGCRKLRKVT